MIVEVLVAGGGTDCDRLAELWELVSFAVCRMGASMIVGRR